MTSAVSPRRSGETFSDTANSRRERLGHVTHEIEQPLLVRLVADGGRAGLVERDGGPLTAHGQRRPKEVFKEDCPL